jgi:hypothetical protein
VQVSIPLGYNRVPYRSKRFLRNRLRSVEMMVARHSCIRAIDFCTVRSPSCRLNLAVAKRCRPERRSVTNEGSIVVCWQFPPLTSCSAFRRMSKIYRQGHACTKSGRSRHTSCFWGPTTAWSKDKVRPKCISFSHIRMWFGEISLADAKRSTNDRNARINDCVVCCDSNNCRNVGQEDCKTTSSSRIASA